MHSSTPPPPKHNELAAFTMASDSQVVMSASGGAPSSFVLPSVAKARTVFMRAMATFFVLGMAESPPAVGLPEGAMGLPEGAMGGRPCSGAG